MNTPLGHWEITFVTDSSPNLTQTAKQKICILANGTWYSTTYPNWHGLWFQKGSNPAGNGNRVRMLGNYAGGVGNDSGELDFVNLRTMTGPWTEWRNVAPNSFRHWTRVSLKRLSKKCPKPLVATAKDTAMLRKFDKREPAGGSRSQKKYQK